MRIERQKGKSTLLTINGVTKSITQWSKETGIDSVVIRQRLRNGCVEDKLFDPLQSAPRYSFNEHYFDAIDSEHKAYWLGFIWCDGYLAIRHRKNCVSYEFKLSLKNTDANHLVKFNNDLNGNYEVKYYRCNSFSGKGAVTEARLLITNQHFGKTLADKYGLVPHRSDCGKLLNNVPEHLMKHFIRGVIDADGSFLKYQITDKGYTVNKYNVSIGTHEDIIRTIERYLMSEGIINISERKLQQRHEGRDGEYRTLSICGKKQCLNILNHIYKESSVYLDRKYEKYLCILDESEVACKNEIQVI